MIWLVGNKGMLGKEIELELKNSHLDFKGTDLELDITNYSKLTQFCTYHDINWIINCAAYTAVDKAEEEEESAKKINIDGIKNLAQIAKNMNVKVIHFSTDYVFDGISKKPYKESDKPDPQTVYGRTKLEGEKALYTLIGHYFVFRISWLYGYYGNNFVNTMLNLMKGKNKIRVVNDQYGSPTYTKNLAQNIVFLLKTNSKQYGIYHYSDNGKISWYDFAIKIKELAIKHKIIDKDVKIIPISSEDYTCSTKRPKYSLLNKSKTIVELKFKINNWDKNLDNYFRAYLIHQ